MTKKTRARLQKEGKISKDPAPVKRDFTAQETMELQQQVLHVMQLRREAALVKGNTALVPGGKALFPQLEAMAQLCDNAKNAWVAAVLLECGYEPNTKCHINISTGKIELIEDAPAK